MKNNDELILSKLSGKYKKSITITTRTSESFEITLDNNDYCKIFGFQSDNPEILTWTFIRDIGSYHNNIDEYAYTCAKVNNEIIFEKHYSTIQSFDDEIRKYLILLEYINQAQRIFIFIKNNNEHITIIWNGITTENTIINE